MPVFKVGPWNLGAIFGQTGQAWAYCQLFVSEKKIPPKNHHSREWIYHSLLFGSLTLKISSQPRTNSGMKCFPFFIHFFFLFLSLFLSLSLFLGPRFFSSSLRCLSVSLSLSLSCSISLWHEPHFCISLSSWRKHFPLPRCAYNE